MAKAQKKITASSERKKSKISAESSDKKAPYISLQEQQDLILSHQEVGIRLAWKLLNKWRVRMHHDDIQSITGAALCDAAYRFNPKMNTSFKTFLFYHLRGLLIKEITSIVHHQQSMHLTPEAILHSFGDQGSGDIAFLEGTLVDKESPERALQKRELSRIIAVACSHLDELEQEVIRRSFVNDEALVDIARDLNYCRCHVSRVKSRAVAILREVFDVVFEDSESNSSDIRDTIPIHSDRKLEDVRIKPYTGGRGRRTTKRSKKLKKAA